MGVGILSCSQPESNSLPYSSYPLSLNYIQGGFVDFAPLAELSFLEHLALQCYSRGLDCQDVLWSSRRSLNEVTLSGSSWMCSTYNCLRCTPHLETAVIKTQYLSLRAAQLFYRC